MRVVGSADAVARCKRRPNIQRLVLSAAQAFVIGPDTVAFTLRVVDNTGAPVAFTVAWGSSTTDVFHLAAGDAYQVDGLKPDTELSLTVDSATATDVAELIAWDA